MEARAVGNADTRGRPDSDGDTSKDSDGDTSKDSGVLAAPGSATVAPLADGSSM